MTYKKNLRTFIIILISILLVTWLCGHVYKRNHKKTHFINSLGHLDIEGHSGEFSLFTMGDAAIIDHRNVKVDYDFRGGQITSDHDLLTTLYDIVLTSGLYQKDTFHQTLIYSHKASLDHWHVSYMEDRVSLDFNLDEAYQGLIAWLDHMDVPQEKKDQLHEQVLVFYTSLKDQFHKDSRFTLIFHIKPDGIQKLHIVCKLDYTRFQASEKINWLLTFTH